MYKIRIRYIDNTEDNLILADQNMVIILAKIAKILSNVQQEVIDVKIERFRDTQE